MPSANTIDYTPSFAGGVLRKLDKWMDERVSVKDFGAVGNGVTDDTAAFNAAYAASKHIYIPKGRYLITGRVGSLTDATGPNFVGEGGRQSVLLLGANGGLDVSGAGWKITNLGFVPNAVVTCAIKNGAGMQNEDGELSNCYFVSESPVSAGANQKYFLICADLYNQWSATILNNCFRNGLPYDRYAGTALKFHYSVNITCSDNVFSGFAIGYHWTADPAPAGNFCEGHMIHGNIFIVNSVNLQFDAGLAPFVSNNILDLNKPGELPLRCAANCAIIQGNWIASDRAVFVTDTDRHIISNNVFSGPGNSNDSALAINNSNHGVIQGNSFYGNKRAMAAIGYFGSWSVTGNVMVGQGTEAVDFAGATNLSYVGNVANGQLEKLPNGVPKKISPTYSTSHVQVFATSAATQTFTIPIPVGVFSARPNASVIQADGGVDLIVSLDHDASSATGIVVKAAKQSGAAFSGGYRFNVFAIQS